MDAVVNPNDDDDDPVETAAGSRQRRRAAEDLIIENPQEVLGRGRRLRGAVQPRGRGRVRGRSRGPARGRDKGEARDRGLVQGEQNEYQPRPQETIDEQFHRNLYGRCWDCGRPGGSHLHNMPYKYKDIYCCTLQSYTALWTMWSVRARAGAVQWQLAGSFGEQSPVSTLKVIEFERDCVVIVGLQLLAWLHTTPPLVERVWVRLVLVNRSRLQTACGLATTLSDDMENVQLNFSVESRDSRLLSTCSVVRSFLDK
ncbi:hypothetical protein J6590_050859 [Homalodisca vitripennis]|nr:hypothetical protein J6590_050859 [Homalodisca vitripennis]